MKHVGFYYITWKYAYLGHQPWSVTRTEISVRSSPMLRQTCHQQGGTGPDRYFCLCDWPRLMAQVIILSSNVIKPHMFQSASQMSHRAPQGTSSAMWLQLLNLTHGSNTHTITRFLLVRCIVTAHLDPLTWIKILGSLYHSSLWKKFSTLNLFRLIYHSPGQMLYSIEFLKDLKLITRRDISKQSNENSWALCRYSWTLHCDWNLGIWQRNRFSHPNIAELVFVQVTPRNGNKLD